MSDMSPQQVLEVLGTQVEAKIREIVLQFLTEDGSDDSDDSDKEVLNEMITQLSRVAFLGMADAYAEGYHGAIWAAHQPIQPTEPITDTFHRRVDFDTTEDDDAHYKN